jgi:hypothetical protein
VPEGVGGGEEVAGQVACRALMVLCFCKELGHNVLNRS